MADAPGRLRVTFPKEEKLCKKKAFAYLFEHGSSIRVGVLSCLYTQSIPEGLSGTPISIAFSVPKRKFKLAVLRNRLKRRMKEAYRLHRRILLDQVTGADQQVLMIFVYQAREELSYPSIEKAIIKALRKMAQEIQPNSPENPVP